MTAGFHAPLPPARTGVADYASVLLEALQQRTRVSINKFSADVNLYHLGNNQMHWAIYEAALARPGVVLLHDAVLQHFFLGSLDRNQYIDEYVYNYGEWERELAGRLYDARASSATDTRYFERPMLRRIAERSLAIVVHNPEAAARVRSAAPKADVVEIPHLFACPRPPLPESRTLLRNAWRVPQGAFLFGLFGYLRESKRVIPVLQTFAALNRALPEARLLLAGTFGSEHLARGAEPYLANPAIVRLGRLPDDEWWKAADAVDAGICLRRPTAGETSGIGVRLMGLGKPVFFTDGAEISRIPADACFRISPGVEERAELSQTMELAVRLPRVSSAIGKRAAEHVRVHHGLGRIADRFFELLCACCGSAH